MNDNLAQKAISAALKQNWKEAEILNKEVLQNTPDDIEALNRLGRAYIELRKPSLAKKTFDQVLKKDLYNQIALKNLRLLAAKKILPNDNQGSLDPNLFLEEPGKTKTTSLVELAGKETLLSVTVGDEVKLTPRKRMITVITQNGVYLGKLADDLSLRLTSFIKGGNQYQAFIKSTSLTDIKIFIKEVFRAKKFAEQPSFSPQGISYQAFVPPDFVHESRPDIPDAEGEERPEEDTAGANEGEGDKPSDETPEETD